MSSARSVANALSIAAHGVSTPATTLAGGAEIADELIVQPASEVAMRQSEHARTAVERRKRGVQRPKGASPPAAADESRRQLRPQALHMIHRLIGGGDAGHHSLLEAKLGVERGGVTGTRGSATTVIGRVSVVPSTVSVAV